VIAAAGAVNFCLVVAALAQTVVPDPAAFQEHPHVREHSGRLLVRPRQPTDASAESTTRVETARARLEPWRVRTLQPMDIYVLQVPGDTTDLALATTLLATGDYEYAEPDWIVYPLGLEPSDPAFGNDWHLRKIEAPAAWSRTTGDGSVTIAFVDTGIDITHPDLAPLLVPGLNSASYVTQAQGGDVTDINGHGTGVAGAAAAMGNNGSGACGVGWNFPIMPIRASNSPSGGAFFSDVLYGAVWAAANGAKIVSVSFAGIESDSVESTASSIKNNYGGLLVWGAGNSATSLNFDRPNTTVVGSTDQNDALASDSNYGPAVDVVAPGVSVFVPSRGGGWTWVSGTSYSTPIASGVLALIWSANPSLTPDQAMTALYQSCDDLGAPGRDNTFGWGRVNAARALASVLPASRTDTDLYPATATSATLPMLLAQYYAVPSVTAPVSSWTAGPAGTVSDLNFTLAAGASFPGAPPTANLGAVFTGAITVPSSAPYTFTVQSSDSARLYIDDRLVVDNSGAHSVRWRAGSIGLFAGPHTVRCEYATASGPITLVVRVRGRGLTDAPVPASLLTH
jgi:subtilisin family serine protease